MNKKKILIVAGLGLVQLALIQRVKAQKMDSLLLQDVVITATKNNQKQSQTGKVTTIIGREILERSNGKSLPELIAEQAGIVVAGSGSNPGLNKSVFFRGAGSAYSVILIDGIVQNDPSGNGGAFDLRLLSIDQIDHIEILRGGQSTIYGSDAIGGVINIITKKSGNKGNTIYGVASAGTYNTYKGTIGLNGAVENFSYNINYTHNKTDGVSEAANPPGNQSEFDHDGFKTDAVNANFGLKLDNHFSVNPFLRYFYGNYNFDAGPFADAPNYSILKNFAGGVNSQYSFNSGKVTLNYSYEKSSNDIFSNYPGKNEGSFHIVDLFYNQQLGKKLDLLLGIDNRNMKLPSADKNPSTNIFAAYSSLFLHDLGIFNLEVGGRYNKHKQYGENYTYSITPSINLIREIKLFGSVSTAFKIPTLNMLFGSFGANLNLKPEKSKNYEAGLAFNFAENKYGLRIATYKRDLTDAIIYAFPNGYINQVKQKTKGLEIEPHANFGKFSFNGYYAYVEGNEFNFVDNAIANYLFRRPKHTFGLTAGIQATNCLFISSNFRYFGKRTDGNFDTNTVEVLSPYKLLNAYAEYSFFKKQLKLFFDAKNLLNEKYTEILGYNSLAFNFNSGLIFNIH